jgi:PAT family beta-lactamase induction signal transducer AmpG|tara:strand:- start:140 stop:1507 length:1368 start_codon:yes stop_codon:yes gene_type:complete
MAMADNRAQRISTLCALYLAQGIPWGFMDITLVNYLIDSGITIGDTAKVASFILLPWAFKLIWAPLIDTVTIRSMGRRRSWIIGAQLMMALTLMGILMIPDITKDLTLLGWMFFTHNIFASLQDVATDALAVDILPSDEQGQANGMMWASKLVGYGGGGYLFAELIRSTGGSIQVAVLMQMALLGAIMILPMRWLERAGEKRFPWSPGGEGIVKEKSYGNPRVLGLNMVIAFSLRTTFIFLVFALFHNLGPEIGKFMAKGICTNDLDWGHVDLSQARFWAMGPEIILALLGGFLSHYWGRRTILIIGMSSYALLNVCAAAIPNIWLTTWFPTVYLVVSPGLIALGSVAFLSMAMRISWTQSVGVVFTTYMALSNVSAVLGKRIIGTLQETFDYQSSFYVSAAMSLLPLLLLPWVRTSQVDDSVLIDEAIRDLGSTAQDLEAAKTEAQADEAGQRR